MNDILELGIEFTSNHYDFYEVGFSIHSPDDLPFKLNSETVFAISNAVHFEILVTPVVVKSDESLKNLDHVDRSCYFENERKLRFFKIYTMRNCEIECFSNFTQSFCNCTPFDVPRSSSDRVCSIFDVWCMKDLQNRFEDPAASSGATLMSTCRCLTTCDSISYNFEIRDTKIRNDL